MSNLIIVRLSLVALGGKCRIHPIHFSVSEEKRSAAEKNKLAVRGGQHTSALKRSFLVCFLLDAEFGDNIQHFSSFLCLLFSPPHFKKRIYCTQRSLKGESLPPLVYYGHSFCLNISFSVSRVQFDEMPVFNEIDRQNPENSPAPRSHMEPIGAFPLVKPPSSVTSSPISAVAIR